VVTFFRLFDEFDVFLEGVFIFECKSVNPRHHCVFLVTSPVGSSDLIELELVRIDVFCIFYVWSFTHVYENNEVVF